MNGIETLSPLFDKVQFRTRIASSSGEVISDGRERPGGIAENRGRFSRKKFEKYKQDHQESEHPLVDYLKENPSQTARFRNLKSEYKPINDLFSRRENWQIEEGNQFLSFADMTTLLAPAGNPTGNIRTDRKYYWNINHHYNVWREKSDSRPRKLKDFHNNIFHRDTEVRDFLMFMLDNLTGRYKSDKIISEISFSKAERFSSITRRSAKVKAQASKSEARKIPGNEKYDLSVFPSIMKKNDKIGHLFENFEKNKFWFRKGEKYYLSFADMASLFVMADWTPNTYERDSVSMGKMKKTLADWKKNGGDKFEKINEPGYHQNNLYERDAVIDYILFVTYRIDFNRLPKSVYAKIMLSADKEFTPVVEKKDIKEVNLKQYELRHGLREKQPVGRPRVRPVIERKKPKRKYERKNPDESGEISKQQGKSETVVFTPGMHRIIMRLKREGHL